MGFAGEVGCCPMPGVAPNGPAAEPGRLSFTLVGGGFGPGELGVSAVSGDFLSTKVGAADAGEGLDTG